MDDWLEILAESSNFSKLTSLDLSNNYIKDQVVRTLSQSPMFSSLTYIDVSNNRVKYEGALSLAKSDFLVSLKRLKLSSYNDIQADELLALRRS